MLDLKAIYNSFDADEPLPAEDDARYVDLSNVRGQQVAKRLAQQIKNAGQQPSHHLLMGHNKCGKTTELNRTAHLLNQEKYLTVFFDVAEVATRTFEYTMVLLLMAQQVVEQLAKRGIEVDNKRVNQLAEFLQEKEVTVGGTKSLEGKVSGEADTGLLASILGKLGFGVEIGGSFQRSREITTKIEADTRGFINAIQKLRTYALGKLLC